VAVIGAEVSGIELAMAIRQRLPQASLTLITGGGAVGADITPAAAQRVVRALKERHITVLCDVVQGIQAGEVLLGCGARLACDVPVIAIGVQAPSPGWAAAAWRWTNKALSRSDACQRATSHANVFAAHGDVSTRVDQTLARSLCTP
jgi:NADPH-dependent 2,4-dienoyl-CoA reductase/sulfur reductase-like enzyme